MSYEIRRGDCRHGLREYTGELFGAVITDPPYSSGGMTRADRMTTTRAKYTKAAEPCPDFAGDNRDQRAWLAWASLWLADAWACTREGGLLGVFTDWRMLPSTTDAIQAGGWVWRGIVPWNKTRVQSRPQSGRFRAQCEYLVWGSKGPFQTEGLCADGFFEARVERERIHITQKPAELMRQIIEICPDGLICDPFIGSGSTLVAAVRAGRRCIGWELVDGIADAAERRLQAEQSGFHLHGDESQVGLWEGTL